MYLDGPPSAFQHAADVASTVAPKAARYVGAVQAVANPSAAGIASAAVPFLSPKAQAPVSAALNIAANPTPGGVISAIAPALKLNKEAAAGLTFAQGLATGNPITAGLMAAASLFKIKQKGVLDPKSAEKFLANWNAQEMPPIDWDKYLDDNPDVKRDALNPKSKFTQLRAAAPDMHPGEFHWRSFGYREDRKPLQPLATTPTTPAMPIEPQPIALSTQTALPNVVPQNVPVAALSALAPPSPQPVSPAPQAPIVIHTPAPPEKSALEKWGVPVAMIIAALIANRE